MLNLSYVAAFFYLLTIGVVGGTMYLNAQFKELIEQSKATSIALEDQSLRLQSIRDSLNQSVLESLDEKLVEVLYQLYEAKNNDFSTILIEVKSILQVEDSKPLYETLSSNPKGGALLVVPESINWSETDKKKYAAKVNYILNYIFKNSSIRDFHIRAITDSVDMDSLNSWTSFVYRMVEGIEKEECMLIVEYKRGPTKRVAVSDVPCTVTDQLGNEDLVLIGVILEVFVSGHSFSNRVFLMNPSSHTLMATSNTYIDYAKAKLNFE